jgi:hypothetical protein
LEAAVAAVSTAAAQQVVALTAAALRAALTAAAQQVVLIMEVSEVPAASAIEAVALAIEAAASAVLLAEVVASAALLVEAVASVAAHTVVAVSALVEEEDKIHFLTHETSSQSSKAAIERFPPFSLHSLLQNLAVSEIISIFANDTWWNPRQS